ncbi:MAG: M55 family metallopeptidase [Bryobacteraceae bacterium]|nr:M55 family metallopeptidase [Bryobacteraceae bacterium]
MSVEFSKHDRSRRTFLRRAAGAAALGMAQRRLSPAQQKSGLKVFMHWDLDGAGGIFTREQAWWWEPNVREEVAAEARDLMTADVNAGTKAALEAGVSELIVLDTHHGGGNLYPEKLIKDSRITYHLRSVGMQDGKRRWMPNLDETVDGLMLPGHHAKTGTKWSFLPHAWTLEWRDFRINGLSVGEIGIEACYAGHWDIPLIFVHGDAAACEEAREQFPWVVTSTVKWAREDPETCAGLAPEDAHKELARGIAEAIEKLRAGRMRAYKPRLPMTVSIRMATMDGAAAAAKRPGVRRLDDHTVEARIGRQADIVKWINGTGLDMT